MWLEKRMCAHGNKRESEVVCGDKQTRFLTSEVLRRTMRVLTCSGFANMINRMKLWHLCAQNPIMKRRRAGYSGRHEKIGDGIESNKGKEEQTHI